MIRLPRSWRIQSTPLTLGERGAAPASAGCFGGASWPSAALTPPTSTDALRVAVALLDQPEGRSAVLSPRYPEKKEPPLSGVAAKNSRDAKEICSTRRGTAAANRAAIFSSTRTSSIAAVMEKECELNACAGFSLALAAGRRDGDGLGRHRY